MHTPVYGHESYMSRIHLSLLKNTTHKSWQAAAVDGSCGCVKLWAFIWLFKVELCIILVIPPSYPWSISSLLPNTFFSGRMAFCILLTHEWPPFIRGRETLKQQRCIAFPFDQTLCGRKYFCRPLSEVLSALKGRHQNPIKNQTQSPPNISRLSDCSLRCSKGPPVLHRQHVKMVLLVLWWFFAGVGQLMSPIYTKGCFTEQISRWARSLTSGLTADAGSSRKQVPLRELIGCNSSWQPATRLEEDNSQLAVLSGSFGLFLVFPHAHGAAGLQCYIHQRLRSSVIRRFIPLSSRKEPLKEHGAKVHRYRFPETWSSVRCRTLNSIKYSPVTSAAQR